MLSLEDSHWDALQLHTLRARFPHVTTGSCATGVQAAVALDPLSPLALLPAAAYAPDRDPKVGDKGPEGGAAAVLYACAACGCPTHALGGCGDAWIVASWPEPSP